MQRSALCGSRRELSNEYLLAKIGVDTAENEPLEVWGEISIQYSLHSSGRQISRGSRILFFAAGDIIEKFGVRGATLEGVRGTRWQQWTAKSSRRSSPRGRRPPAPELVGREDCRAARDQGAPIPGARASQEEEEEAAFGINVINVEMRTWETKSSKGSVRHFSLRTSRASDPMKAEGDSIRSSHDKVTKPGRVTSHEFSKVEGRYNSKDSAKTSDELRSEARSLWWGGDRASCMDLLDSESKVSNADPIAQATAPRQAFLAPCARDRNHNKSGLASPYLRKFFRSCTFFLICFGKIH